MPDLSPIVVPLLRRLEPERAHALAVAALRIAPLWHRRAPPDAVLATRALGLDFQNPLGLAAGFDKNAGALPALARLGFGFVEAGTVTLRPQPGNPRPRVFRLTEDRGVINRLGFNGAGSDAFSANVARSRIAVPLGVNLGINKDSRDPEADYAALAARLAPHASYLTINVSSPNTPGLRALQAGEQLSRIIAAVQGALTSPVPLLVKVAPDLPEGGLAEIMETCLARQVQGLIISNTTVSRPPGLRSAHAAEPGGLSGAPLFPLSTMMLARARLIAGSKLVLVGVGGIETGAHALTKIKAGASLLQLYTAFAYGGPARLVAILAELAALLRAEGFQRLEDAVGIGAAALAQEKQWTI